MNNLEAFGICICMGIICGSAVTCAFASLGLIEVPKTLEEFLEQWADYIFNS